MKASIILGLFMGQTALAEKSFVIIVMVCAAMLCSAAQSFAAEGRGKEGLDVLKLKEVLKAVYEVELRLAGRNHTVTLAVKNNRAAFVKAGDGLLEELNPNSDGAPRTERGSPDPQRVEQAGPVQKFPVLWPFQRAAALESRAPGTIPTSEFGLKGEFELIGNGVFMARLAGDRHRAAQFWVVQADGAATEKEVPDRGERSSRPGRSGAGEPEAGRGLVSRGSFGASGGASDGVIIWFIFSTNPLGLLALRQVDTRIPSAVEEEVRLIHRGLFPEADRALVPRVFDWAMQCFSGRYGHYQPIDARYHDLEHTLQGTLCLARLLQGYQRAEAKPALTAKLFELGLLAILFHDTGYLKQEGDSDGTGAKYTLIHVDRSADFARDFLKGKGYAAEDIQAIRNMINCTGVNVNLGAIAFAGELERNVGFALGTADLLGQMAAGDYIDKLPILYAEFAESARFNAGKATAVGTFTSAEDLMRKTPVFWEKYVHPKIENSFLGLYRYLNEPFPTGPNYYLQRIESNLARLRQRLAAVPVA